MKGKPLLLIPPAVLFLAFGVLVLITAFHQSHPFEFLVLFFSSNFIILLSGAMIVGLVWRTFFPGKPQSPDETNPPEGGPDSGTAP